MIADARTIITLAETSKQNDFLYFSNPKKDYVKINWQLIKQTTADELRLISVVLSLGGTKLKFLSKDLLEKYCGVKPFYEDQPNFKQLMRRNALETALDGLCAKGFACLWTIKTEQGKFENKYWFSDLPIQEWIHTYKDRKIGQQTKGQKAYKTMLDRGEVNLLNHPKGKKRKTVKVNNEIVDTETGEVFEATHHGEQAPEEPKAKPLAAILSAAAPKAAAPVAPAPVEVPKAENQEFYHKTSKHDCTLDKACFIFSTFFKVYFGHDFKFSDTSKKNLETILEDLQKIYGATNEGDLLALFIFFMIGVNRRKTKESEHGAPSYKRELVKKDFHPGFIAKLFNDVEIPKNKRTLNNYCSNLIPSAIAKPPETSKYLMEYVRNFIEKTKG